jgi:hypothetical protein
MQQPQTPDRCNVLQQQDIQQNRLMLIQPSKKTQKHYVFEDA